MLHWPCPLPISDQSLNSSQMPEEEIPSLSVLNRAACWKHDIVKLWRESAWISWNMLNVTSCSDANTHAALPPSNITLIGLLASPLVFRSSAFHHSNVHFLAPILSSLLFSEWGNSFGRYVQTSARASATSSRIDRGTFPADSRVELRPLLQHRLRNCGPTFQFCFHRHADTHKALIITSGLWLYQPTDLARGLRLQRVEG